MAKQLDYEDKIVTGGRFIERAGKGLSLKDKLRRLSNTYTSANTNASIKEISKITSDNVITPSEKRNLAQEWGYIQAAFASITNTVSNMGEDESEEYLALKTAYENLADVIEPILADMNTTTELTTPIDQYIEAYTNSASVLNIYLSLVNNSILEDVSNIGLEVRAEYDYIKPYETVKLTAMIFTAKTGQRVEISDEIKDLYKDPETGLYPKLYQWTITGTTDDDYWNEYALGRREVEIPYSSFDGNNVSAFFRADMVVGE